MSDETSENTPEAKIDNLLPPQVGDVIFFRTGHGSIVRREIVSIERKSGNTKRDKIKYNETKIGESTDAETWQVWVCCMKEQAISFP